MGHFKLQERMPALEAEEAPAPWQRSLRLPPVGVPGGLKGNAGPEVGASLERRVGGGVAGMPAALALPGSPPSTPLRTVGRSSVADTRKPSAFRKRQETVPSPHSGASGAPGPPAHRPAAAAPRRPARPPLRPLPEGPAGPGRRRPPRPAPGGPAACYPPQSQVTAPDGGCWGARGARRAAAGSPRRPGTPRRPPRPTPGR